MDTAGIPPEVKQLLGMADLLRPTAIRVAATLRIADQLADSAADAETIAHRTGTDPVAMGRLLRYLAALGFLDTSPEGEFTLTELGGLLRSGTPLQLQEALDIDGIMGRGEIATTNLLHTVRTGKSAYAGLFGREYWEDVSGDPVFKDQLRAFSHSGLVWEGERILKEYDWSQVNHVADVGGNKGQLLIALLREFPHLRGTLVDLPNQVELADEDIAASGLADRCTAVVGDFFERLPEGGDVYVLSGILADWDDESAVRILRRCAEACGTRGRILVADINIALRLPDPLDQAAAELRTMATVPGLGRDAAGVKRLAALAGLEVTWEGEESEIRSLLELSATGGGPAGQPRRSPSR